MAEASLTRHETSMPNGSAVGQRANVHNSASRNRAAADAANIGAVERIVSTAVGGVLVARAIQKRSAATIAGGVLGADLIYRGVTGQSQVYRALGVNTAASNRPGLLLGEGAPEVRRSITIDQSAEALLHLWRDPRNLPRIVAHFAEVTPVNDDVMRWRVRGPLKQILEWESRTTETEPGRRLSWQSLPGSQLPNRGEVSFQPARDGLGTEVTLHMRFEPPLGELGARLVKTFHLVPRSIAGQTLHRFKSLVETGEIPSLRSNPSGRGSWDTF